MTTTPQIRHSTPAAARLTRLAGWSLIVIAALHTAVFVPQSPWADWIGGSLRTNEPDMESVALFWALPGGIVVPAAIAGLLMIRFGRQRQRLGIGVALALFVWVSGCLWVAGPSGFMLIYSTVGLLIAAVIADRKRES